MHRYMVTPKRVLGSDSEFFFRQTDAEAIEYAKAWAEENDTEYDLYRLVDSGP